MAEVIGITGNKNEHYKEATFGSILGMDSGVVNVWSGGGGFSGLPSRAGVMIDTISTTLYDAKFTESALGPQAAPNWRASVPQTNSDGQFAGQLRAGSLFIGRLPPVAEAPSFAPFQNQGSDATDPLKWVDVVEDTSLVTKKTATTNCPASMFTGRARLYAQALYGHYLHPDVHFEKSEMPFTLSDEQGRPKLLLKSFKRVEESSTLPAVDLSTSSGVYLDKGTGKHYLFNPGEGRSTLNGGDGTHNGVAIYPLIAEGSKEALRRYLKVPKFDGNTLLDDDIEKLEAYILSTSLPDYVNQAYVTHTLLSGGPVFGMGYGWHWNWTGLNAVLVLSQQVQQSTSGLPVKYEMKSQQYAMAMSQAVINEKTVWTINVTSLPEERWTLDRDPWTILEPNWVSGLDKVTNRYTNLFECSATYYAFYRKDELIKCSVSVASHPVIYDTFKATLDFDYSYPTSVPGQLGFTSSGRTIGTGAGYSEWHGTTPPYWTATFQVGDQTYSELELGKANVGLRSEVFTKTKTTRVLQTWFAFNATGGTSCEIGGPLPGVNLQFFPPTYDRKYFSDESHVGGKWRVSTPGYYSCTFKHIRTSFSDRWISVVAVIVPAYDAEAVLTKVFSIKERIEDSRQRMLKVGNYVTFTEITGNVGGNGVYEKFEYMGADVSGTISTHTDPPLSPIEVLLDERRLTCRGGVFNATTFDVPPEVHYSAVETVPWDARTLTSAAFLNTVVIPPRGTFAEITANGSMTPAETKGIGQTLPASPFEPVLVGWV